MAKRRPKLTFAEKQERKRLRDLAAQAELTPRNCLKCGEQFGSTNPGNRLCDTCNRANNKKVDRRCETGVVASSGRRKPTHQSSDNAQ
jgi:uncharacterized OB-fold protein